MLAAIERHAEARCAVLLLRNEATATLRMQWATVRGDVIDLGSDPLFAVWQRDIPEDLTPAWRVMCEQPELILEPQAGAPHVWPFSLPWHNAIGNRSVICVALHAGEQHLGFLGVGFDRPRAALGELTITLARAHPRSVTVELSFSADGARLTVSDDGYGFNPAASTETRGFGLIWAPAARTRRSPPTCT